MCVTNGRVIYAKLWRVSLDRISETESRATQWPLYQWMLGRCQLSVRTEKHPKNTAECYSHVISQNSRRRATAKDKEENRQECTRYYKRRERKKARPKKPRCYVVLIMPSAGRTYADIIGANHRVSYLNIQPPSLSAKLEIRSLEEYSWHLRSTKS